MSAEVYVTTGRRDIEGWFEEADAWMFIATDHAQPEERGDLLEIGVYLGRSAALLGYLARPGERVLALDLFDDPAPTPEQAAEQGKWYSGLTRERFETNYRCFHEQPPVVLQGRSDELLPDVADRSARFVHIDGSHAYEAVKSDIEQVCRIATPNAVLAFDDITGSHTPGVAAAVWGAVLDRQIVPLVQTKAKLYATMPGSDIRTDVLQTTIGRTPLRTVATHDVAGSAVLEVVARPAPSPPRWRRALRRLVD